MMIDLTAHLDLILLGGLIMALLGILVLLLRQGRMMQERNRLEELLHNQERLILAELSARRETEREQAYELQQKLLLQLSTLQQTLERRFGEVQKHLTEDAGNLRSDLIERFDALQKATAQAISEGRLAQQEGLGQGFHAVNRQLAEALSRNAEELGKRVDGLTTSTDERLKEISGQVEKRLSEGFEKTTETFSRVLEHLGRIDEAQKRITELSTSVVSLQEVLTDKRSRGAFGEVQLSALVRNLLPEQAFALQHSLSNGTRVDCMLFLPEPTGNVPIDSKFPLESFQRMTDPELPDADRAKASSQFKQDIKKHISDIAEKYLIPGETADGAIMFIPAEAIFAEIHAHYPDLVEEAYRQRVWLVSPTTLMAILTTARAVLKDEATREQVHIIQDHLRKLSEDFGRFEKRMGNLAQHIRQANKDVDEVNVSARKISARFGQIEKVELDELPEHEQPILGSGKASDSGEA
jgi:DNA recombination protein RmuC